MSQNRVIGRGNSIPWHLPEDFKFFKATTMGHILVMGRKTFESIGRPLPGRQTIVLSRSHWTHPGVLVASGLDGLPVPAEDPRRIFICGGAEVYRQALPRCAELFLTQVNQMVEGDAFFPPFETDFVAVETMLETQEFKIVRYRNRTAR